MEEAGVKNGGMVVARTLAIITSLPDLNVDVELTLLASEERQGLGDAR
jgi:hypothetical protein